MHFDPVLNPGSLSIFEDCGEYSWDEMSEIITTLCKAGYDVKTSHDIPKNNYKHFYLEASKEGEDTISWDFQIIDEEYISEFGYKY